MSIFCNHESLITKHNQLRRKLYNAYINDLPLEIINSITVKKISIKEQLIASKKKIANSTEEENSEKVA